MNNYLLSVHRRVRTQTGKIIICITILILIFGIGFFMGRKISNPNIIRTLEFDKAITNIINYTNYIHNLKYITNDTTEANCNLKYEELKVMYNNLLKKSKDVALNYTYVYRKYDELFKSYEKLEAKANRKLYFLAGTDLIYNINKNIIDMGVSCGIEYNRFGFMVGYMFLDRQVNLNVYYRF